MWALLAALASAAPIPTVADWSAQWGPPTTSLTLAERTRSADEPLLVYWMQTRAAPLGLGPALPGTLVANFDPATDPGASRLQDFTFLAVATADEQQALEKALREARWVREVRVVERAGGTFRELVVAAPDGRAGTVALRTNARTGGLGDGRPSPTVWVHLAAPQAGS